MLLLYVVKHLSGFVTEIYSEELDNKIYSTLDTNDY